MLFDSVSQQNKIETQDRVAIRLKTLIALAQIASNLNLRQSKINAQEGGAYVSRLKGRGMEFDEARLYQPGDDIRSIDWKVTARSGKTHTKLFREEREKPVFISVDYRLNMHFATRGVFKSVLAAKLAGLLAWGAQYQGDRIGGQIFSDFECTELKPQNGKHAVLRFLNALVKAQASTGSPISFEHVLARLVQHTRPGSQIYIISDFRGINPKAELFLARIAQHCQVNLLMVYDPLEQALPTQGRYRFTDTMRDVVVDAADQKKLSDYHQRFVKHQQTVQTLAKKLGLGFIECSTIDDPLMCLQFRYR
ncbi:MAG: DUF58 domain-containing protein [Methylococcaceae bacterium]|jgi:uncharacterized protein (DUF58 family)